MSFTNLPGTRGRALLLLLALLPVPLPLLRAQCPAALLAVVNSCVELPRTNGQNGNVEAEIILLQNGAQATPVAQLGVDLPFNGFGAANGDVGLNGDGTAAICPFKMATVTQLTGCPNAVAAGPGTVIPAGGLVVFITTGMATTADFAAIDFSEICGEGQRVFILQNACERTVSALANAPGTGASERTVRIFSPCGNSSFTYDAALLPATDGSFYDATNLLYGERTDCSIPGPAITCPPDTTLLRPVIPRDSFFLQPESGRVFSQLDSAGTVRLKARNGCDSILDIRLQLVSPVSVDTMTADTMTIDSMNVDTMPVDTMLMDTMTVPPPAVDSPAIVTASPRIYLPTAFSPNNDRVNDRYEISFADTSITVLELRIYSRQGALVHRGPEGWDGRQNGEDAPVGTYLVLVEFRYAGGRIRQRRAAVNLVR